MKTTIAWLLILSAGILSYFKFKEKHVSVLPLSKTQSVLKKHKSQGEKKHESTNVNERRQSTHHGEDEGIAGATSEIEGLTSIYQDEEGQREQQQSESLEVSDTPQLPQNTTVIHGVKVAAWVRSQKNHINSEVPDPSQGSGMRLFFNCMELKQKGTRPLSQVECVQVLSKHDVVERKKTY